MRLEALIIDNTPVYPEWLSSEKVLGKINARLNNWDISTQISEGLGILMNYRLETSLSPEQQIQVARLLVTLWIRAVTDSKISLIGQESADISIIQTFNTQRIVGGVDVSQVLDDESHSTFLLHQIEGTSYGIYKNESEGKVYYYILDTNKETDLYGILLSQRWNRLESLEDDKRIYALIDKRTGIDIYEGSMERGFTFQNSFPKLEIDDIQILGNGTLGIMKEDIFTIYDIISKNQLLQLTGSDFSEIPKYDPPVEVFLESGKYLFIYEGFDPDGDEAYIAIDDDLCGTTFYSQHPITPIITPQATYFLIYSQEQNLYAVANFEGIMCGSIKAIIDENDNYYIWGNIPDCVTAQKGICNLRFVYGFQNEAWEYVYDVGYIFSGIETDGKRDASKPSDQEINIFSDSPSVFLN